MAVEWGVARRAGGGSRTFLPAETAQREQAAGAAAADGGERAGHRECEGGGCPHPAAHGLDGFRQSQVARAVAVCQRAAHAAGASAGGHPRADEEKLRAAAVAWLCALRAVHGGRQHEELV